MSVPPPDHAASGVSVRTLEEFLSEGGHNEVGAELTTRNGGDLKDLAREPSPEDDAPASSESSPASSTLNTTTPATQVLSFGSNVEGALMREGALSTPQPVPKLAPHVIVDIACSPTHSVVVTDSGALFASGLNDEGLIKPQPTLLLASGAEHNGVPQHHIVAPHRIDLGGHRALGVSMSERVGAALTSGQVPLTWGSNEHAALGHSSAGGSEPFPPRAVRGLWGVRIAQVSCGTTHTLLLSRNGEVFSAGSMCGVAGAAADAEGLAAAGPVVGLAGLPVAHVAAGDNQSFAVSVTGVCYAWGRTGHGSLGLNVATVDDPHPHGVLLHPTPVPVPELVQQVACGGNHTVWVSRSGRAYSAGRNQYGQLGLGRLASGSKVVIPTLVGGMGHSRVREAACGANHTLLLSASGEVWACGDNREGQLGLPLPPPPPAEEQQGGDNGGTGPALGIVGACVWAPVRVPVLSGYAVFRVAAGGDHSLALRVTRGAVELRPAGCLPPREALMFFDARTLGALAQKARVTRDTAALRTTIREVFSRLVNLNGSLLREGAVCDEVYEIHAVPTPRDAGAEGDTALAHTTLFEAAPGGSSHASCGEAFDKSASQASSPSSAAAAAVAGPPAPGSVLQTLEHEVAHLSAVAGAAAHRAASTLSGAASAVAALVVRRVPSIPWADVANSSAAPPPVAAPQDAPPAHHAPHSALTSSSDPAAGAQHVQQQRAPGPLQSASEALSTTFLDVMGLERAYSEILQTFDKDVTLELQRACSVALDEMEAIAPRVSERDCSRGLLALWLNPMNSTPRASAAALARLCCCLLTLPQPTREALFHCIGADVPGVIFASRMVKPLQAHIAFHLAACLEGKGEGVVATYRKAAVPLAPDSRAAAAAAPGTPSSRGADASFPFRYAPPAASSPKPTGGGSADPRPQGVITHIVALELAVRVLRLCYQLNETLRAEAEVALELPPSQWSQHSARAIALAGGTTGNAALAALSQTQWGDVASAPLGALIPASEFVNPAVSGLADAVLQGDYVRWQRAGYKRVIVTPVVLLMYPFLFDAAAKRRILLFESAMEMQHELQRTAMRVLFAGGVESLYLQLHVHRDNVLSDTLNQLAAQPAENLKKPLKVVFVGEEAIDEGGPAKELFQLIVRQVFSADYGMFSYSPETRLFWFNPAALPGMDSEYYLVGVVVALALYNGVLLPLQFPPALFKMLLGQQVGLYDLRGVFPSLAKSFELVLSYSGEDFEGTFCVSFEAPRESSFGEAADAVELVPGGNDVPVTADSRYEYVRLYTQWLLSASIAPAFAAFSRGFKMVLDGHALSLFSASELELLVSGTPHLDFTELQSVTKYDGGFSAAAPYIQTFWRIVLSLPTADQKALLTFVTGSSRVPIGGLSKLEFKLQRNGGDTDRLPTASTCYNTLLLPQYASEAKLRDRLVTAITEGCEGFGLR